MRPVKKEETESGMRPEKGRVVRFPGAPRDAQVRRKRDKIGGEGQTAWETDKDAALRRMPPQLQKDGTPYSVLRESAGFGTLRRAAVFSY